MGKGAIASLAVSISAKTNRFEKGLKKAGKATKLFAAGITRMGVRMAKMGAVAAGAALAGVVLLTKQALTAIDAIAKLAVQTGMSTESIAGLQLQFQLAGLTVDETTKSMLKMTKSIGEAALGFGQALPLLEDFGINIRELAAMSPEDQFAAIAEATSKLATQSERAAFAAAIFGRTGTKLTTILAEGRRGMEESVAMAEKLGLSFNAIEGKQVENANDAITRMKSVLEGVGRTIAIKVAPLIEFAADKLTELGTQGEGSVGIVNRGFRMMLKLIGKVADTWSLLKAAVESFRATFLSMVSKVVSGFVSLLNVVVDANNAIADLVGIELFKGKRFDNFLGEGLEMAAKESFDKMNAHMADFVGGKSSKALLAWFDKVTVKSQMAAEEAIKSASKAGSGSLFTAFAGIGQKLGKQFSESFVEGLKQKRVVDTLNEIFNPGVYLAKRLGTFLKGGRTTVGTAGGREVDLRNVAFTPGARGGANEQEVHDQKLSDRIVSSAKELHEDGKVFLTDLVSLLKGAL